MMKLCYCADPAQVKLSTKPGKNKYKLFYGCPNWPYGCKFIKWLNINHQGVINNAARHVQNFRDAIKEYNLGELLIDLKTNEKVIGYHFVKGAGNYRWLSFRDSYESVVTEIYYAKICTKILVIVDERVRGGRRNVDGCISRTQFFHMWDVYEPIGNNFIYEAKDFINGNRVQGDVHIIELLNCNYQHSPYSKLDTSSLVSIKSITLPFREEHLRCLKKRIDLAEIYNRDILLFRIPQDILLFLCYLLSGRDVRNLSCVCRQWGKIVNNDRLTRFSVKRIEGMLVLNRAKDRTDGTELDRLYDVFPYSHGAWIMSPRLYEMYNNSIKWEELENIPEVGLLLLAMIPIPLCIEELERLGLNYATYKRDIGRFALIIKTMAFTKYYREFVEPSRCLMTFDVKV